ncbi:MAG: ABC transporter permease [Blautia sp.]|nr:ABC transporter permease [Blautia sp.]
MGGYIRYFWIQIKRIGRMLPAMQFWMLLLILCLGTGAWLLMKNGDHEKEQTLFEVGLVGNTTDSYLGFGVQAIQSIDTSRYMVHFQTLTEEEADRALKSGKLSCYVRIPDGLVDSLVYGRNDIRAEIVTTNGDGIFASLAGELADIVSNLVLSSQSAVFGMQRVLYDQGMAEMVGGYTDELNLRFFGVVLNRTDLCGQDFLGIRDGLSAAGYYLCGLLVFFLMLAGVIGSPLFACRNRELNSLLASKGTGAAAQVVGEYLAYAVMNLLYLAEAVLLVGILHSAGILGIEEWKYSGAEAQKELFLLLVPVSLMLSALQFLIYEMVSGMVGSILLQFTCSIVMGYLAGCFYPYTFFPDILQKAGSCLPVGAAVRYVQGGVAGDAPVSAGCVTVLYLALFLGLAVAVRKLRTERGK